LPSALFRGRRHRQESESASELESPSALGLVQPTLPRIITARMDIATVIPTATIIPVRSMFNRHRSMCSQRRPTCKEPPFTSNRHRPLSNPTIRRRRQARRRVRHRRFRHHRRCQHRHLHPPHPLSPREPDCKRRLRRGPSRSSLRHGPFPFDFRLPPATWPRCRPRPRRCGKVAAGGP
jgi:hypothetical protein